MLKLGGSAITIKERPMTPNLEVIGRLAGEIKEADVKPLIIVHGGGGFGHWWATKYQIKGGYRSPEQIMGFSKTHQAMTTLNKLVVDALINRDIPAVAVQPSSFIITKLGRIHVMEGRPLIRLLEMGFVPVLYGDAILDFDSGFTILSGDQLVASLAMQVGAERIIIGVDVNGLYTADPKTDPSASLIQRITPLKLRNIQHKIEGAKVIDVTGGMLGKIMELIPAIEQGIPVMIINAMKPTNVYKALKGEEVIGTIIERDETVA